MNKIITTALTIILLNGLSLATPLSGDIQGVLSVADSPYEVVGDIRVPQGQSLEIEAGCYFDFQGQYTFTVDTSATLRAMGEPGDSITFTSSNADPGWRSIRFLNSGDSCQLDYCIIENSYAKLPDQGLQTKGGGIYSEYSTIYINNCRIINNNADNGLGGGMYLAFSIVDIYESEISYNHSSFNGGGIYCTDSELSIISCSIIADTSWFALGGDWGGGLDVWSSVVEIINCNISHNYCGQAGGGFFLNRTSGKIANNVIAYNTASDRSGGVAVTLCSLLVFTDNIVAFNSAEWMMGGGVMFYDSYGSINNNTFYGNQAYYSGGGLQIYNSTLDSFENNIFWNNWAYDDTLDPTSQIYNPDSSVQLVYSCIQGSWEGEGNIDTYPLFVDPENGDFNLSWDNFPIDDETKSPCIDAGAPWSPPDYDGTRADIGALPFSQLVSIDDTPVTIPRLITLHQNYPNPFNVSTLIGYSLPCDADVKLDIYDVIGRHIKTLFNSYQSTGHYQVIWNAINYSSGAYFYKLQVDDFSETKMMMLIK